MKESKKTADKTAPAKEATISGSDTCKSQRPKKHGLKQGIKNIHAVALSDWKRLRSNVVALVVLMGLIVLPVLYGWFNIMSNWSPYSEDKTSRIKVAVMSEDKGVDALNLLNVNVGEKVIDALRKNTVIGWQFTDTKDEAVNGVVAGDYYAAIIIPEDFSEQIVSVLSGFIQHPHVEYYENMKRNAIAPKITGKAQISVTQQINETFQGEIVSVITKVGELLSGYDPGALISNTINDLDTFQSDIGAYISLLDSFNVMLKSTDQTIAALQSTLPYMRSSLCQMKDSMQVIDNAISGGLTPDGGVIPPDITIPDVNPPDVTTPDVTPTDDPGAVTNPEVSPEPAPIDDPAQDPTLTDPPVTPDPAPETPTAAERVHTVVENVNGSLDKAIASIDSYQDSIASIRRALQGTCSALYQIQGTLSDLKADLGYISDELNKLDLSKLDNVLQIISNEGDSLVDFIKAPVSLKNIRVYPVETYGSTTAPFYSVLAIWIGSLILVVIVHTKVLPEPGLEDLTHVEGFFGRFICFFVLGQLQAALIVLGDLFFIGIQCLDPFLFWLACSFASTTFTLMMYSMVYSMGNVGEAAGLVLLVIQVAGSGGSYPIEVLPAVYQKLYVFMPFNYAMNAIRETIAGKYGQDYWRYLRYLFIFIGVSLGIALLRKPCQRLMEYIEEKKSKTYLIK